jgi:diguanylate cyclase (GGDEF)-like protein
MSKSVRYENQSFIELKRKLYFILLPVLIITFLVVFFVISSKAGSLSTLNIFTFSVLCTVFTLCYILLFLNRKAFGFIEIVINITAAIVVLMRLNDDISSLIENNNYLGTVSYWVPLLHLLFFFTFRGTAAFVFSAIVMSLTLIPGIQLIFFREDATPGTFDTLIQFYIATFGFIVALYHIQRVFEVYLQAEAAKRFAYMDFLTGLPNRRKLDETLSASIDVSKEDENPLTVILFDIDNFKQVNDTYGHDVGDAVLKSVATNVKNTLSEDVSFGRWGGEEFIIIAPNKTFEQGREIAKIVQQKMEENVIDEVGVVTASFGVATLQDNDESKDILKNADQALYKAKESGKNTVF